MKEIKQQPKAQEGFTVNVDISIMADSKSNALQKVSNLLSSHKLSFYLGEVITEKQLRKLYEENLKPRNKMSSLR